jgi:hypothetical protein
MVLDFVIKKKNDRLTKLKEIKMMGNKMNLNDKKLKDKISLLKSMGVNVAI